jgi:YVTN family beta-propeller protein
MNSSWAGSSGRLRRWRAGIAISVTLALLVTAAPSVAAAPLTTAWAAKIGSAGANGTATINTFTTGAGEIVLKLAKFRASTAHTVVLSKGTCGSVGTAIVKFASIKASSSGAAARTTSVTAAQVSAIKAATKGTGKIAIRIAYGSTVRCGVFARIGVPPYVAAQVTVGRSPSGVAIDASGVWVTNWWDNTLSRIDPATNTVLSVVPVDFTNTQGPEAIGSGAGSLWVTATDEDANGDPLPGVVKRIDPATGATLATIPVGAEPLDIDVSPGAVWVANWDSGSVIRIDPATNQIVTTLAVPYASGVTFGLGAVWVAGGDGKVTRIDPATNAVMTTIPTQATGGYIATGNGAVWVTHPGDRSLSNGSLSRIDPVTNQVVANIPLGSFPQEVVVSGTDVWVGLLGEATVLRVSATTNTVLNRVAVSSKVYAIAVGPDVVWAVHNLPTPQGGSEPPVGAVSRISASAPIASAAASPTPAATPTPTPTSSTGRMLFASTYFMMAIPAGWSPVYGTNPSLVSFTGPGSQDMAVSIEPSGSTLDEIATQIAAVIKAKGGGDPEKREAVTLGGSPAWLLTYHFSRAGGNVHQLEAICVRNGKAYEISYANVVGTEGQDRTLFLEMLASFTFMSAAG